MNEPTAERLLVDPSLLLSLPGRAWLQQDDSARKTIVVSAAFSESLTGPRDRLSYPLLPSADLADLLARREFLRSLLEGVVTFSHRDADLAEDQATVRDNLLEINDPDAEVFADEWAYLQTHSWFISTLHRPLDAFRQAGAAICEFGERVRDQLIQNVIPRESIPEVIDPPFLARVGAKWLVLGSAPLVGMALAGAPGVTVAGFALLPLRITLVALDP